MYKLNLISWHSFVCLSIVIKSFISLWIPRWAAVKPIIIASHPAVFRCVLVLMLKKEKHKIDGVAHYVHVTMNSTCIRN